MNRRALIAGALVIAASAGLLIWKPWREPYSLPEFDRAVFIDGRDLKAKPIAASDLPQLRAAFARTYRDHRPAQWIEFGMIRLFAGERTALEIELFQNEGGPGPFRIEAAYYLGYDQDAVRK